MLLCLPTCDVRDLIFSQFSIDCQKCVCFRGSAPGPAGGAFSTPNSPAGQSWVTNRSCPDRRPCFHIHVPLAKPMAIVQTVLGAVMSSVHKMSLNVFLAARCHNMSFFLAKVTCCLFKSTLLVWVVPITTVA